MFSMPAQITTRSSGRFIDGPVFMDVTLSSISIESGNDVFAVENGFLVRNHPNSHIVSGCLGMLSEK
jgi:hypothetical protein